MPEDSRTNIHRALSQFPEFFRDLVDSLARDLVDEMKLKAKEANWHQKVIDSIRLSEITLNEGTGKIGGKIICDYTSTRIQPDGNQHSFNVAEGMEYGTQPHYITRRWAPLLRWVDKQTGRLRSAFEVFNPGMGKGVGTNIQKLGVIHDTGNTMMPKIQAVANSAWKQYLVLSLNGQQLPQTWYNRGDLA